MSQIDPAAIAARAHALYLKRGSQPGKALDDWLEAERQLRNERAAATLAAVGGAPTPAPAKPAGPPSAPAAPAAPAPVAPPAVAAKVGKKSRAERKKNRR